MTDEQKSRLNNVYNAREQAIAQNNKEYDTLINQASSLKDTQDNFANEYEQKQNQIADANLAFTNNMINQQKEEAKKQNKVEQAKALNEYEANRNPYGYQSEVMGNQGLSNSGVSETMKLGMYSAYQNRVATANTALNNAMTAYNNALLEAQKDNDVAKAQNALTKLQTQLQNAESYFNNFSSLTQNKLNQINALNERYDNQYNTVYNQILDEQKQAEAIRQYNEQFAYQKERDAVADKQWQMTYDLQKAKASSSGSSGGSGSKSATKKTTTSISDAAVVGANAAAAAESKTTSNNYSKALSEIKNTIKNNKMNGRESMNSVIIAKVANQYGLSTSDIQRLAKELGL